MAREKRISLLRFATVVGDVLHLSGPVIHRIFVPLNHLPANGRRQVVKMLDDIRNGDGASMAQKCASILIKGFVDELLSNNLVSRKAVLMSPTQLVTSGCGIHSILSAKAFVTKTFNVAVLPRCSRLKDFLKTSLDLCGESLLPALADRQIFLCSTHCGT